MEKVETCMYLILTCHPSSKGGLGIGWFPFVATTSRYF